MQMPTFLTAEWRKLVMAQYAVPPELLAPYLPAGVELDLFRSLAYVSLVGFLFDRTRVKGVAIPFHTRFEEINLRFYVKRREADGSTKRGVVFIRELVPRSAIATVARVLYEEPYLTARTLHTLEATPTQLSVSYSWHFGERWHSLAVDADPTAQPILPGTEEEFITEHYWGYTKRRSGRTSAYQVEHPRWLCYPIRNYRVEADFAALYGPEFGFLNEREPNSVLLAEGSAVSVYSGQTLAT
jgi:uncharacterized protein YqjF (DUF2071 family)